MTLSYLILTLAQALVPRCAGGLPKIHRQLNNAIMQALGLEKIQLPLPVLNSVSLAPVSSASL